jgi:hypothetical protein
VLRLGDAATKQEYGVLRRLRVREPAQRDCRYNYNPPTNHARPARRRPARHSPPRSIRARRDRLTAHCPQLAFKVDVQIALDGALPPPVRRDPALGAPGNAAAAGARAGPRRRAARPASGSASASRSDVTCGQFASSGFRLWNLGIEAKILYTTFCVLTLCGIVSSALYYGDLVGAGTGGIKSYYAGEAKPRRRGAGARGGRAAVRPRDRCSRGRAGPSADRRSDDLPQARSRSRTSIYSRCRSSC